MVLSDQTVIRAAFLGGGRLSAVGRAHFAAIHIDTTFTLTAGYFSQRPDENQASAAEYGISPERCASSLEALAALHEKAYDVVIVLTPTSLHYEHVSFFLQRGIPVICEKSLVASRSEAESLRQLVTQKSGFLSVTYNYTGYPMVRELQALIRSGELGTLQQIMLEMPQEGFLKLDANGKPITPQGWRLNDGTIPTVSLDLGAHLQMFVEFLSGEHAESVVACSESYGNFSHIQDSVSCLARYPSGMTCNFWYSKAALGYRNGLKLRVFGSKGAAEWFQMEPELLQLTNNLGDKSTLDRASGKARESNKARYTRFKAGHPAGYIEAFANYYHDIANQFRAYLAGEETRSEYVFGVEHELRSMELMEAIHRSSATSQWVTLRD